jgi:subtilase family serine protease
MLRAAMIRLTVGGIVALLVIGAAFAHSANAIAIGAPVQPASERMVLSGYLVPQLAHVKPIGHKTSSQVLNLSIALTPRNRAQLAALIAAQNNPHSPLYHHYITPAQYDALFGPDQATVNAVVSYLRSQGISVGAIAPNHLLIDASGTVSAVEHAFGVTIDSYVVNHRPVYAPTGDPSFPASLAGKILSIGGLDNVDLYHPKVVKPSSHPAKGKNGSGPGGGYTPSELRTAYDMNSLVNSDNGAGQTVAIFELDGYIPGDINAYLSYYGLGSPNYSNVLVDGATNTAGAGAIEVELDMEDVSAIAPGAAQKIYIGPNTTQGVNDTYNKIVTDDIAKTVSTSWGLCEAQTGNSELAAEDAIFQEAAAQGQAIFAAAGDSGAYDCGDSNLNVDNPADDPYVVGVGGTSLTTGSGGSYSSETVWSDASLGEGGGGGLSTYFKQPTYQSGPGVSNSYSNGMREVPDVSADADPNTGYSIYCTVLVAGCVSSGWLEVGGTSAGAPLWTALTADTNEYLAGLGKPTLGSASVWIYQLFNTTQTYAAYHDITTGNNLYYPATAGYDLASGIGTPDVWNFARDAANLPAPVVVSTDQSSYPTDATIQVTVKNSLNAAIYAFDSQASCSVLQLQIQNGSSWQSVPVARCSLGRPTQIISIDADSTYTATIQASSIPGHEVLFPTGTYRLILNYATSQSSLAAGTTTQVISLTFTVS